MARAPSLFLALFLAALLILPVISAIPFSTDGAGGDVDTNRRAATIQHVGLIANRKHNKPPSHPSPPNNRTQLYNKLDDIFAAGGLVCWSLQPIPQIWKNYVDGSTYGLSPWLFLSWSLASFFGEGSYSIALGLPVGLILQGLLGGVMLSVCLFQCMHYSFKWSITASWIGGVVYIVVLLTGAYFVGIWLGNQSSEELLSVWGSAIVVVNAFGLVTQYWEIWKLGRVLGTSSFFLGLDILGGLLSIASLVFHWLARPGTEFEWVYFGNFAVIVGLESGIAILYAWIESCGRREIEEDEVFQEALEEEQKLGSTVGSTASGNLLAGIAVPAGDDNVQHEADTENTPLLANKDVASRRLKMVRSNTLPSISSNSDLSNPITIPAPTVVPPNHPLHATFRARPEGFVEGPPIRASDIKAIMEQLELREEDFVAKMDPRRGRQRIRRKTIDRVKERSQSRAVVAPPVPPPDPSAAGPSGA